MKVLYVHVETGVYGARALRGHLEEQIARGTVRPLDAGLVAQVITISGLFPQGMLPPAQLDDESPRA